MCIRDRFWIVGYDVKDVEMPDAPAVTGFTANAVDSTSVTFSWDDVLANKSGFSYGVGMLQSNAADAIVNSWKIADNTQTSLTWDGLQPNTAVSYTHLDVYKRQPIDHGAPTIRKAAQVS